MASPIPIIDVTPAGSGIPGIPTPPLSGSENYMIALYVVLPIALVLGGALTYFIKHLKRSSCCGNSVETDLARSSSTIQPAKGGQP